MILLFTDFGWNGPYVGQMKAVLAEQAPGVPVIDLMHDAPTFSPYAASYILAALLEDLPWDVIVCAVVDPGVGGERPPVVAEADGRKLVGPGNGLFEIALRRARNHRALHRLTRTPVRLSASFHGRDLFAPAAAALATGKPLPTAPLDGPHVGADWPDECARIIYIDAFGNAMTGLQADSLGETALVVGGRRLPRGRTFVEHPPGMAFWYANSCGLAEIAINRGNAAQTLGLELGNQITIA